jgi:hypothetical protein
MYWKVVNLEINLWELAIEYSEYFKGLPKAMQ